MRLQQGRFDRETRYDDDPLRVAGRWVDAGADCLHLVDLDGAKTGRPVHADVVADILKRFPIACQIGGGIRSRDAIRRWLEAGADRLVVGTRAFEDPDWFATVAREFPDRLVLGLDVRDGCAAVGGWDTTVGGTVGEWLARFDTLPLAGVVFTDIARDGMLEGPNVQAVAEFVASSPWPVVASGGVTTCDDVVALRDAGAAGCIIGRALYEGTLALPDALRAAGKQGQDQHREQQEWPK